MSDTETLVEHGQDQMMFETVDNGVIELPCSTPAVYEFKTEATTSFKTLERALAEHGFTAMDEMCTSNDDGFYFKCDILTDHCKRATLKAWSDECRIFPNGELLDRFELSRILHAIEEAFGSELVRGGDDE